MKKDYWVPKFKYELVDALVKIFGETERNKLKRMKRKQLYAIYFKEREKNSPERKEVHVERDS